MADSRGGPELSELETFVFAVEDGSIARAAARSGISSPAAAKRIRQLEVLSAGPLLIRGRRGVTATELGMRLYPLARGLLTRRDAAVAALTGTPPGDADRVAHMHEPLAPPGAAHVRRDTGPRARLVRPAPELAANYLAALRRGDQNLADGVVEDALEQGSGMAAIHSHMIDPAMKVIGDLWEQNEITVADEHLATEISQRVAARLFWKSTSGSARTRQRVVMAAVQGEHHVLGLRLAADVLESAGFDVLYLGANLPLNALLDACRLHQPELVGLTVTMPLNLPTLTWEVTELRKLEPARRVIIGGQLAPTAIANGILATYARRSDELLDAVEQVLTADELTSSGIEPA